MNYSEKPKPANKHKEWYIERDRSVYQDRESGMTWRSLASRYELSETYLRIIIDKVSNLKG